MGSPERGNFAGQAAGLRERLIALGHVRDEESFRLSWALTRLVLHRGDPDLNAVTFEDVEEMRQVIKNLGQVPGITEVIDPARLPSTRRRGAPAPTGPGWRCSMEALSAACRSLTVACPVRR